MARRVRLLLLLLQGLACYWPLLRWLLPAHRIQDRGGARPASWLMLPSVSVAEAPLCFAGPWLCVVCVEWLSACVQKRD